MYSYYYDKNTVCSLEMQNDMDKAYMEKLHPKIYCTTMPYIKNECIRREKMGHISHDTYPSQNVLDEMVEEIYNQCYKQLHTQNIITKRELRLPLLKNIISILLIYELLDRRRYYRRRLSYGF